MRQLTNTEKEVTEKGIKNVEKELIPLKDELDYNQAILQLQQTQRDFEDKWKNFKRDRKDEADNANIDLMISEIKIKEAAKENMIKQLNEGVDEKEVK